ncbi:hypothetical protein J6590_048170 [Homalodisca vitripennis]|nr:hypothetical protein J6590_048170 [Homalodisca vitripennis]
MAVCTKCAVQVDSAHMLVCAECKGVFHPSCTRLECIDNFKKLSTRKRAGWKCDACATETDSVVSQDGRMESELSLASLMEAFQSMGKELGAKITGVKTSVDSVQEQLVGVNNTIGVIQTTLNNMVTENEHRKSELAALKQENHEMREEMADLHQRVREIEQYSRKDNVEIVGVPLTRGEDIYRRTDAKRSGHPPLSEEVDFEVLCTVVENPQTSSRQIADNIGVSQRKAITTLKKHKFHPYKIMVHHALNEDDPDRRLQFCETMD